jgi:DNA-binding NarL/FixJ family response regulator
VSQTEIYVSAPLRGIKKAHRRREGQDGRMGSRVLVYAGTAQELESVLRAVKAVPEIEIVGVIQDMSNILVGIRSFTPDVLVIRTDTYTATLLDITTELRELNTIHGIVAIVGGTVDNAGVISLLKSGVNAIISIDASPEDLGIAIREAAGNRLFIPPRRRDGA